MVTTTQKPVNTIGTNKLKREEDKHIIKKNHQIIREEIKRRKKKQELQKQAENKQNGKKHISTNNHFKYQ